jgi:hypothetical protein
MISVALPGAEAGLAFEIGTERQVGLERLGDFGTHARAPELSAPEPFHTYLRIRATPLETLSQLVSASSRR